MRLMSPVKKCRQKVKPSASAAYRIEGLCNPEMVPQYFQITVNILEAQKLAWANPQSANSYVVVVFGKEKHRTSIRRSMVEPYYKEYFTFEWYANIRDMEQSSLWLAVMEPRCCAPPRLLGEANIDLGAIWAQPNHQVFQKWAQLSLPRDPDAGAVGFIKMDITIVFRGDVQVMSTIANDVKVEDNLLLSSGSEQQSANYLITIYGAAGLPIGNQFQGDRRYGSIYVKVSFCGLVARTSVQQRNNNPVFCEQISIVEMFPNICQTIRLEVCLGEECYNKVLAGANLKLRQLSHDGENGWLGFVPTFGPSLVHMYGTSPYGTLGNAGENAPYYQGALLVALKTIVPYYQQGVRSTNVEPVPPIHPDNLWSLEDFCIFCPILEVSMLDRRIVDKSCGIAITIGEVPNNANSVPSDEEFMKMMNEIKSRKLHYTESLDVVKTHPFYGHLNFSNALPVLQLATRLPDFRFRMYRNNMMYRIVVNLELEIAEAERRLKNFEDTSPTELLDEMARAIDDTSGNILKFLDIIMLSCPIASSNEDIMEHHRTELDRNQLMLQKYEIEKIYQQISKRNKDTSAMNRTGVRGRNLSESYSGTKKEVKIMLAETKALALSLKKLIFKTSEGWPDIVIWLLRGGTRVAYYKISAADVIFSVISEQNGKNCGRIQTVYLKPLKCPKHLNNLATSCFCIAGKVELLVWMGLHRQMSSFNNCLPKGFQVMVKDYDMCVKSNSMMLECRVFIYRAKLTDLIVSSNLPMTFVRICALNSVKETKLRPKTLTPVWNRVLKIHTMTLTSKERLYANPPVVLVEIWDSDLSDKMDLVGRCQILPVVDDRQSYDFAPKMQWHEIYKGEECTGQILISAQLLQLAETLIKTTIYSPEEETLYEADANTELETNCIEKLPPSLVPKHSSYKVDVYWWGLRGVNITKKPCVVLELDELIIKSDIISDKKSNSNFPNARTSQTFDASLNETYCPQLCIRLYDSSTFGRILFLGTNVVKNPNKYIINWLPKTEREASLRITSIIPSNCFQGRDPLYVNKSCSSTDVSSEYSKVTISSSHIQSEAKRSKWKKLFGKKEPDEEEIVLLPFHTKEKDQLNTNKISGAAECKDWWLRFFSSQECFDAECCADKIKIYNSELETQPEFSKFKDWCSTLKLYNGKKTGIPETDDQLHCGFLKAGIAIYRWPPPLNTVAVSPSGVELRRGFFNDYPSNDPTKFLVRTYIVKGINLVAKDFTGKSDPYVVISCGSKHLGDRNNYVPNNVNPVFGKMYEFRCSLPEDYLLTVSLYNYDAVLPDELIGSTTIDLEDRIYSKHMARVGISYEYNSTGPSKWRDCVNPSVILEELCCRNHIPSPVYTDATTVVVNGVEYSARKMAGKSFSTITECKENICLSLLHRWHTLPLCGYHLVPEHVETRRLLNPDKYGADQGKILMWVDIFPLNTGAHLPLTVDITPRKVEEYELRVIVWGVQDVKLDVNESSGKTITDIYVKAWIGNVDEAQYTDVHFGSICGKGSFNWRMIFHFQYQHAELKLYKKEQGMFTEFEQCMPPMLIVQVMDSDAVSQDDFLSTLMLDLNALPRGMKLASQCSMDVMEKSKKINLFSFNSIRAWWPLKATDRNTGMNMFAVKENIVRNPPYLRVIQIVLEEVLSPTRTWPVWWTTALLTPFNMKGTRPYPSQYIGVIDLEITLLPKEKSVTMPVGLGREPPFPLPEPYRPGPSKHSIKTECFNNHRGAEYVVIGAVLLFTFVAAVVYLEIPSVLLNFLG